MNQRIAVAALVSLAGWVAASPTAAQPSTNFQWLKDERGNEYREIVTFPATGSGSVGAPVRNRIYRKFRVQLDGEVTFIADPRKPQPAAGGGEIGNQAELDQAVREIKAADPDAIIDDKSFERHRFGAAGIRAGATTLVIGFASQVVNAAQAARVKTLEREVADMEATLNTRLRQASDVAAVTQALITERAATLEAQFSALSELPDLSSLDVAFAAAHGQHLYATSDPEFALKLHGLSLDIAGIGDDALQFGEIRRIGQLSVRLADIEHAVGNESIADEYVAFATTLADVLVGLDPVSGVVRSTAELLNGRNLITGEELSMFETGVAFLTLATAGAFGTLARASTGLTRLGKAAGLRAFNAFKNGADVTARHFPKQFVDNLIDWKTNRFALSEDGFKLLSKVKALPNAWPSDGAFARVMRRDAADQLRQGGLLSRETEAFITAAEDVRGLTRARLAERLGLYLDSEALLLKPLDGHVIVEFKLKIPAMPPKEPTGLFGERGFGWIPAGRTLGGAREWIAFPDAMSNGLFDVDTIVIREIKP